MTAPDADTRTVVVEREFPHPPARVSRIEKFRDRIIDGKGATER